MTQAAWAPETALKPHLKMDCQALSGLHRWRDHTRCGPGTMVWPGGVALSL